MLLKMFLSIFSKTFITTVFTNIWKCVICYFNQMTSLQTFFWQTFFQNNERKHFSLSLFLPRSKVLDNGPLTWEKKGQVCKDISRDSKTLERPFFSVHFQNSICSGVFSPKVGCGLYSRNCIQKELYYIWFYGHSPPKSLVLLF